MIFLLGSLGAYAQDAGGDHDYLRDEFVSYEQIDDSDQYYEMIRFEDYIVFGLLHRSDYGLYMEGFNVYSRDGETAADRDYFAERTPVFSTETDLEDPFAPWFDGIYRNLLFIDYGTAPGLRGLDIVNLETREIVYSGMHYSGFGNQFRNERTLLTYRRIDTDEVLADYPEVFDRYRAEYDKYMERGLWYSFVRVMSVDLIDFTETDTGEIVGIVEQ